MCLILQYYLFSLLILRITLGIDHHKSCLYFLTVEISLKIFREETEDYFFQIMNCAMQNKIIKKNSYSIRLLPLETVVSHLTIVII